MELIDLPPELVMDIILRENVDYRTVIDLCNKSRELNEALCRDDYFWLNLYRRDFSTTRIPQNVKQAFLKYKRNYEILGSQRGSLIIRAISNGHEVMVRKLLETGQTNELSVNGLLIIAAYHNYTDIMDLLRRRGAELSNIILKQIIINAIYENSFDVIDYLNNLKKTPEETELFAGLLAYEIVEFNTMDMLKYVLDHNVELSLVDLIYSAILHLDRNIIDVLRKRGYNIAQIVTNSGVIPDLERDIQLGDTELEQPLNYARSLVE